VDPRALDGTSALDNRWMPSCQCGWTFYASVRRPRIAHRTHGDHPDEGARQPHVRALL